jgi:hypothetical protein
VVAGSMSDNRFHSKRLGSAYRSRLTITFGPKKPDAAAHELATIDPALLAALDLVLADVRGSGVGVPRIEPSDWTEDPDRPAAFIRWPSGAGLGVAIDASSSAPRQLRAVAEGLQESVIEEVLRLRGSAVWPECPAHLNSHPLDARVWDGHAIWACPRSDLVVAEIGYLPGHG